MPYPDYRSYFAPGDTNVWTRPTKRCAGRAPAQMAGAADRRVGRSALEYSEVLKDELAAIKADVSRLLAE